MTAQGETTAMHEIDEYAANNLDLPERHRYEDVDGPHWIGFNCVDATGCFLTEITPSSSEQIHLTREQIEWMAAEGLPALLRAMDREA